MFPNPKRRNLDDHIYRDMEVPLLKQAAVYGPNGAGKSNLVEALRFIERFAVDRHALIPQLIMQVQHALHEEKIKPPVSLLIEFSVGGLLYVYSISVSPEEVEQEALYLSGPKGKNMIYVRRGRTVQFREEPVEQVRYAIEGMLSKNPLSSLLSLNEEFPILVVEKEVSEVYEWFKKKLLVVTVNSTLPQLIELLDKDADLYKFTEEAFKAIGLGLKGFEIHKEKFDQWASEREHLNPERVESVRNMQQGFHMVNQAPVLSLTMEEGVRMVKEMLFSHLGRDGYVAKLDIIQQSDGTIRLLTLLPAIYGAMKKGQVVIVDEIENSIHPLLVYQLVRYFASQETNGQLIFTTHETLLLNQQKLMRVDEVWMTEKQDGATRLYSLNEFNIHHTKSLEKGYLEGRFGAIPWWTTQLA